MLKFEVRIYLWSLVWNIWTSNEINLIKYWTITIGIREKVLGRRSSFSRSLGGTSKNLSKIDMYVCVLFIWLIANDPSRVAGYT